MARRRINIVVRDGVRTSTDLHMVMIFAVLPTVFCGGRVADRLVDGAAVLPDFIGSVDFTPPDAFTPCDPLAWTEEDEAAFRRDHPGHWLLP